MQLWNGRLFAYNNRLGNEFSIGRFDQETVIPGLHFSEVDFVEQGFK